MAVAVAGRTRGLADDVRTRIHTTCIRPSSQLAPSRYYIHLTGSLAVRVCELVLRSLTRCALTPSTPPKPFPAHAAEREGKGREERSKGARSGEEEEELSVGERAREGAFPFGSRPLDFVVGHIHGKRLWESLTWGSIYR